MILMALNVDLKTVFKRKAKMVMEGPMKTKTNGHNFEKL